MSSNGGNVMSATHQDTERFFGAGRVDLKNIGEAEARKLMSAEHKALGFRPPPGSLAATAQAEAAKHPNASLNVPESELLKAATEDAIRILEQGTANGLDLDKVGEAEARKLMSEEHKALGYRPPPGSIAAAAQAAAAKHPDASVPVDVQELKRAALEDAASIASLEGVKGDIDVTKVGAAEARKLMSEEHKALGYRPPPGSLAATTQAEAAKHPEANACIDSVTLTKAAVNDARYIETTRQAVAASTSPPVNPSTLIADEARAVQSEEQKTLGYRPPVGSLAAQAQSAVDTRADPEPVTKELSADFQSQENKALGHLPKSESLAATAQSLADKNENDGGKRTLGEVGL